MVGGITLRAAQPAPNIPTLSHNAATTVALSTGNTIDGFIITNSAGNGISGSAIGTTAIADIAVTVTGGTALNATTSGTLTVTGSANTLSSTNGTALNVHERDDWRERADVPKHLGWRGRKQWHQSHQHRLRAAA